MRSSLMLSRLFVQVMLLFALLPYSSIRLLNLIGYVNRLNPLNIRWISNKRVWENFERVYLLHWMGEKGGGSLNLPPSLLTN